MQNKEEIDENDPEKVKNFPNLNIKYKQKPFKSVPLSEKSKFVLCKNRLEQYFRNSFRPMTMIWTSFEFVLNIHAHQYVMIFPEGSLNE